MPTMMDEEEGHRLTADILRLAVSAAANCNAADVEVDTFDVSAGTKKGDNFSCIMKVVELKAKVNGEEREFNFMTKGLPLQPAREQMTRKVSQSYN